MRFEFLVGTKQASPTAALMLGALIEAAHDAGDSVLESTTYTGKADVLVLYGVGADDRSKARALHVASGRCAILWDLGYFEREKITGYLRCSINHDHPQHVLDLAPDDPSRWEALRIPLRNDFDPYGPIILVGLGRKSRAYLHEADWEVRKFNDLRERYAQRRIIYRPKPGHPAPRIDIETDEDTPIDELLIGASLVVCRHSNVAVDGIVHGIPFEAEDGAAMWLANRAFTRQNRLEFLYRLAWFQWRTREADGALAFLKTIVEPKKVAA